MDLTDPSFPHGTTKGAARGCGKTAPCPATPTCYDAKLAANRAWSVASRQGLTDPTLPKLNAVLRRMDEAIETAGEAAYLTRTGYTSEDLDRIRATPGTRLDWETAERLDAAWTFLVHGYDTTDPSFEHGRGVTSYTTWFCRCRVCRDAQTRVCTGRRIGRKTNRSRLDAEAMTRVQRHAARLADHGTAAAIARAASLSPTTVRKALAGETLAAQEAARLMALRPADVAAKRRLVPSELTAHRIGTMNALGYACAWMATQVPFSANHLARIAPGNMVAADLHEAIEALATKVGDTPATPESIGRAIQSISHAKRFAALRGYYPPACYDDDLNLIPRAIPDHPWSKLDDRAARAVEACFLGGQGLPSREVAERVGLAVSTVQKHRERWWGYASRLETGPDRRGRARRKPAGGGRGGNYVFDFAASRDRIREVCAIFNDWQGGQVGPVTAALLLGFRLDLDMDSRVPADHPEIVAWRAHVGQSAA